MAELSSRLRGSDGGLGRAINDRLECASAPKDREKPG